MLPSIPRIWKREIPSLTDAELAVFVAGVSVMGLEILAGRIVAPEFGSSIYTWGSIIGVFMTGLGVGYYYGGQRAAEHASELAIAKVLIQATMFVAFLLVAGELVLQAADAMPLPPRFAPLVPIAILFGPPSLLLGYVSPYAAQLSTEASTGGAAGRVYSIGTIGSIAGTFGTTFFLIPWLNVATVELGFGLALVLTAAKLVPEMGAMEWLRVATALLVLGGAFGANAYGLTAAGDVVYQTQTPYQELEVTDERSVRTMYLDGAPQSAMALPNSTEYVFDYPRYFHLGVLMSEDVDRVLFIGGGGFSGPKRFLDEYPDVEVDVVELDPAVIRVAREYFHVEDTPRMNIYNEDGRRFLEDTDRTYDLIVLDAYRKDRVPFHMTTVQFMELAAAKLDDDGVLVANVIAARKGSGSQFYRAEYRTMDAVFPNVYSFPTSETTFLQNIELVATKQPDGFTRAELQELNRQRDVGLNLSEEIGQYRSAEDVPTDDVPILRDDKAPVDRLLDPQLGRRYVIEKNGTETPASLQPPQLVRVAT